MRQSVVSLLNPLGEKALLTIDDLLALVETVLRLMDELAVLIKNMHAIVPEHGEDSPLWPFIGKVVAIFHCNDIAEVGLREVHGRDGLLDAPVRSSCSFTILDHVGTYADSSSLTLSTSVVMREQRARSVSEEHAA